MSKLNVVNHGADGAGRGPPSQLTQAPVPAGVVLEFKRRRSLGLLVAGLIGAIAECFVEDHIRIDGSMRDVTAAAAGLLRGHPVSSETGWWRNTLRKARSAAAHSLQRDAEQSQFHCDLSDAF